MPSHSLHDAGLDVRPRWALALPLVPAVALVSSVFLPFVNSSDLWWGVPSLFVWTSIWVLLITPALLTVHALRRSTQDGES